MGFRPLSTKRFVVGCKRGNELRGMFIGIREIILFLPRDKARYLSDDDQKTSLMKHFDRPAKSVSL